MPPSRKSAQKRKGEKSDADAQEAAQGAALLEEAMSSFRSPQLVTCRYGVNCYDHSPAHRARFSHPSQGECVPCKYGAACYDFSQKHRARFSHEDAAKAAAVRIQALSRGRSDRNLVSGGGDGRAAAYFHSADQGTTWEAYDAKLNSLVSDAMKAHPGGGTLSLPPPVDRFQVRWGSEATSNKLRKPVRSQAVIEPPNAEPSRAQ